MSFLQSVKGFFTDKAPASAGVKLSLKQQAEKDLAATPEGEKEKWLEALFAKTEQEAQQLVTEAPSGVTDPLWVAKACEHFDLECFVYQELQKAKGNTTWQNGLDTTYEELLARLPVYLRRVQIASSVVLKLMDDFLQKYEDALYLAEARGEYTCKISENGRWLSLPLLQAKEIPSSLLTEARKKVAEIFFECPEASHIELSARVPWQGISLLEFSKLVDKRTLAAIKVGNGYYFYLFD